MPPEYKNPHQMPSDDWLEQGLKEALHEPPLLPIEPAPSGNAMLNKQPPASSPQKPKSLAELGISRGGIVRNPSTVHRTQLNNPVANPRTKASLPPDVKNTVFDQKDLPPTLGVPGTIMTGMDADLERNTQERIQKVMQPVSALDSAYEKPPAPVLTVKDLTLQSAIADLLRVAMNNSGTLLLQTPKFVIEVTITT
jgi:hypothetical protein